MYNFIQIIYQVLGFMVFFFASAMAQATLSETDDTLVHQREVFKALEKLVTKPNSSEFKRLRVQIEGYPLEPYIEQLTLKAHPYLANQDKINAFLTEYEGSPLDRSLRYKWLHYLKDKNYADLYKQYFRPTANVELTCQYLTYQLADPANIEDVFKQTSELWVVGKSQPNECDVVFDAWTQAGFRTNERVLKRLELLGNGGSHTLIPYLKTLLPGEQQYLAELWLQVRRAPNYVSHLSKFPQTYSELELNIIQYGLERLIWRDEELAIKTWQAVLKKYDVSQQRQYQVAGNFAVALAVSEHEKADEWLEKASYEGAEDQLYRWHLAHVLKTGDWQHALEVIEQIPEKTRADLSFKYWQARALEKMNALESANQNYQWLAQQRHYYGFLASGKLAQTPNIADRPLDFDAQTLSNIANMNAAKRAYEFFQLGRYTSARREWVHLQSQLNQQQKLVSAVLADSWGWHDRAIYGFSNTGYLDDVKRRFPMAYRDVLVNQSEANQVDPAWAFAIARRESSFMADANSSAGAKGLMQLLPGTARYLAKKQIKTSVLFDPDINAGYGTQYLRYLMDKMDNNAVLATASYNAGWRRVQKWVPKDHSVPMDVWIETIPYKETRNYVKAVLAYRQIYAMQLGKNSPLFNELANMQLGGKTL